ncbi:unnamed protein product, partial [Owenia fusiformis]
TAVAMVAFEQYLEEVGSFGKYQIIALLFASFSQIPSGFHNVNFVYIGAAQDHYCAPPTQLGAFNLTEAQIKALTIPIEVKDGNERYSECEQYVMNYSAITSDDIQGLTEWLAGNGTRTESPLNASKVESCETWVYDTSVYETTVVSEWNLICEKQALRATTQSIFMVGRFIGSYLCGYLADRFGRKAVACWCLIINIVFGIGSSFSPNYTVYTTLRFVIAASYSGIITAGFIWRNSESPRWLFSKGRYKEAAAILKTIARVNGKKLPKDVVEALENIHSIETKDNIKTHGMLNCADKSDDVTSKCTREHPEAVDTLDLIRTPNIRRVSIIFAYNWLTVILVYYGLSWNTGNIGGDPYINQLISGSMDILGNCLMLVLFTKVGRRLPMCSMLITGGVALLMACTLLGNESMTSIVITLAMLGKLAIGSAVAMVWTYTPEAYPTYLRAAATGAGSSIARVGAIIAPYLLLLGDVTNKSVPLVIFGVLSLVAGLSNLWLPETRGKVLPETILEAEHFLEGQEVFTCRQKDQETTKQEREDISKCIDDSNT